MAKMIIDTGNNTIKAGTGAGLALEPSSGEVVTINNGALLPDGSVSEPALRFSDDTNTGLYSPSNDVVALAAHGADMARFVGVSSAVNYLEVTPSTTGNDVAVSVEGSDSNIDLAITAKGTGNISLGNFVFDVDQTVGAGQDDYVLTYDDASGVISLEAAGGGGGGNNWVNANAGSDFPVAPTTSGSTNSIAIGNDASALGTDNIAIGTDATLAGGSNTHNIAIGDNARFTNGFAADNIAIGRDSGTTQQRTDSIFIGRGATHRGTGAGDAVVIGRTAAADEFGIAVGQGANAEDFGTAVGASAFATGNSSVAVGRSASGGGSDSVAVGRSTAANGASSVAVGLSADAGGTSSVAVGSNAEASGLLGIAIGSSADAEGGSTGLSIAIGVGAKAQQYGVGIGNNAGGVSGTNAYAIGIGQGASNWNAPDSIAIGRTAEARADSATAIGPGSDVTGANAIALGHDVTNTVAGTARIGYATTSVVELGAAGQLELEGANSQFVLPSYTVATLPTGTTGGMILVTDETGGAVPAFYDGTDWRRVTDRAVVS